MLEQFGTERLVEDPSSLLKWTKRPLFISTFDWIEPSGSLSRSLIHSWVCLWSGIVIRGCDGSAAVVWLVTRVKVIPSRTLYSDEATTVIHLLVVSSLCIVSAKPWYYYTPLLPHQKYVDIMSCLLVHIWWYIVLKSRLPQCGSALSAVSIFQLHSSTFFLQKSLWLFERIHVTDCWQRCSTFGSFPLQGKTLIHCSFHSGSQQELWDGKTCSVRVVNTPDMILKKWSLLTRQRRNFQSQQQC